MKVPILPPLILMVKLHLQRHCSPQTLQTAITQKPSSSSPTEKQRIPCLEEFSGYRLGSTCNVFSHPSSLWLTGCYRTTSVALEMYFSHTFLALYFRTFPFSIVWYHWIMYNTVIQPTLYSLRAKLLVCSQAQGKWLCCSWYHLEEDCSSVSQSSS